MTMLLEKVKNALVCTSCREDIGVEEFIYRNRYSENYCSIDCLLEEVPYEEMDSYQSCICPNCDEVIARGDEIFLLDEDTFCSVDCMLEALEVNSLVLSDEYFLRGA